MLKQRTEYSLDHSEYGHITLPSNNLQTFRSEVGNLRPPGARRADKSLIKRKYQVYRLSWGQKCIFLKFMDIK